MLLTRTPWRRYHLTNIGREVSLMVVISDRIIFNATGSVTLVPNCSSEELQLPTILCGEVGGMIRASLLSPIAISAVPPIPPPNRDAPGCIKDSESPSWALDRFTFDTSHFRPGPFEISTVPVGRLSFNLTNKGNNYSTTCSVINQDYMNYLYSEAELDVWYDCASVAPDQLIESAPPDLFKERPEYKITTFVRFYKITGQLSINQTWYCDKDPQNTYVLNLEAHFPLR